ncbi:MAG TPA: hypothetical protein VNB94_01115 [Mycobacteriales bacterium]|nr:hypothetical protein [Mycobacteriales bacterium]
MKHTARRSTRTALLSLAAVVATAALAGCSDDADSVAASGTPKAAASSSPAAAPTELEQVRTATAAYADTAVAKAAGYTVWSPDPAAPKATCPSSPEGKMGYHLVNPGLRGAPPKAAEADATIDFAKPEQLLYQKKADGTMELVGVEYLVFKAAWERENGVGAAAPQVLGQPVPASKHSFAPGGPEIEHYELHVWLHTDNPNGMFAPYHPTITC